MRNFTFFVLALAMNFGMSAQVIDFPDPIFKARLLNTIYPAARDINNNYIYLDANEDGEIEVAEITNVTSLLLENSNISNLTGLSYFTNLIYLDCTGNQLTQLDLTGFEALINVRASNNNLNNLQVHGLSHLYSLLCDNNQLTELNLSGLSNLDLLNVQHNLITELDASVASHLRVLTCSDNRLVNINITELPQLRHFRCYNNELTTIDLSGTTNLMTLDCNDNFLGNLDLSLLSQLNHFDCFGNQMTTIDVNHCPDLHTLDCRANLLETLYIKNGTYFSIVDVGGNFNLGMICANESDINGDLLIFGFEPTMYLTSDCSLSTTIFASNPYTVYPNPTSDVLYIDTKQKVTAISVYTALGQLILTSAKATQRVDVSALPTGYYLLRIETGSSSAAKKFYKI